MKTAPEAVTDDELHAYVDAQLDADRVAAVLAWLQSHPDDAARVAQWQLQRARLRQLARSVDVGDTPPALLDGVMRAATRARRLARWQQGAAAALLLAVGLIAGMAIERSVEGGRPPGAGSALAAAPLFVREAAAAHAVFVPEKRHPVEVTAADEAHLVQWLSRRLGAPLKAPSLGAHGYHLLGGRLLPGEGTPRAQFMYENQQGSRVTLFVAAFAADAAPSETAFRLVRDGARTSFYWVEDRYGYALSADGSEAEVRVLVSEVYAQLNR
jgi:anti-sigma factor RsiW